MKKYRLLYTKKSVKDLKDLPKKIAKRILDKLGFFVEQENPLVFADRLKNPKYGTYRYRVGDYRVIFDIDNEGNIIILVVLTIKHRREVYKNV